MITRVIATVLCLCWCLAFSSAQDKPLTEEQKKRVEELKKQIVEKKEELAKLEAELGKIQAGLATRIEDAWTVLSVQLGEKPASRPDGLIWHFKSGAMTGKQDGKETARWTYKIDATKDQPEIDFFSLQDGKTVPVLIGIVKMEGDNMTIAAMIALPGADGRPLARPKGFDPAKAYMVVTLKRGN